MTEKTQIFKENSNLKVTIHEREHSHELFTSIIFLPICRNLRSFLIIFKIFLALYVGRFLQFFDKISVIIPIFVFFFLCILN